MYKTYSRQELYTLKKTGVKTTVVCPSFINTGMFEGVSTRLIYETFFFSIFVFIFSSVLFPLLKSETVCDEIVEAIQKNQELLLIPKILKLGLFLKRLEES